MRITPLTAIAPLLFVVAATLSAPAFATDTQQALTMCNARGSEAMQPMTKMEATRFGSTTARTEITPSLVPQWGAGRAGS
jgi:hypothetical protein